MNDKDKIELVLKLARKGDFGTPDNMNKRSSGREAFWRVFEGIKKASDYRGTITYPYAKAGELYRKEAKVVNEMKSSADSKKEWNMARASMRRTEAAYRKLMRKEKTEGLTPAEEKRKQELLDKLVSLTF